MSNDAEDLISRLSAGLDPHDRAAFRRAAENAVATSPECSGEGSTYRVIAKIWRGFFRAPSDTREPGWYETRRKREVPRFVASSKAHHQPAHKAPCRVSGKS
jgi:hypothetical protein